MIEQILGNWLCWVIFLLALVCYQQLWLEYFVRRDRIETEDALLDDGLKRDFSAVLIGALPLLGLLGTIVGLLECFAGIASEGASSELISGGISDALLTTQLGLVCAIPGWLLQAYVKTKSGKPAPLLLINTANAAR